MISVARVLHFAFRRHFVAIYIYYIISLSVYNDNARGRGVITDLFYGLYYQMT